MPGKLAIVDFNKCQPDKCENGVCSAARACEKKLMKQLDPYDPPMTRSVSCKGCGDCVTACPFEAVSIEVM
ncbi:MAG: 4Fe-4S binding protein [Chloroflexi bacterium]|jgi:translation initiation factor RLI1|nr:4Fe-4S binding protein [Chloroflexota bacterium]MBT7080884.1 4Fe-4S binding protein [Chloroflexota bacterium]MBT7290782.1 4Fe-4S binding protein [Chloroflexota bacterium]